MKNLKLKTRELDRNLECHFDSPFIEKNGLLEFNPEFTKPEFLTAWTFETKLYGEIVSTTLSSHFPAAPHSKTTPNLSAPSAPKQSKAPTYSPLTFVRKTLTFPPICGCI